MTAKMTVRRVEDIEPARLSLLNAGLVEASNLTECLAVDFGPLMRASMPGIEDKAVTLMDSAAGTGISRRMALAGRIIAARYGLGALDHLLVHPSDTVRGWACFVIGSAENMPLSDRLALIRPLADDPHFGVREWAWMAIRPHIAGDLSRAIALLAELTGERSERLRRFACEATRPRGVWCSHIGELKSEPERALPILEPLRDDKARYVQDSVGNWLNDASKTQPDWVRETCARWLDQSPRPETAKIVKRALRSIGSSS